MDRRTSDVWQRSRATVEPISGNKTQMLPFGLSTTKGVVIELPRKPESMSDLSYARLVFTEECTSCGEPATVVLPELARRACGECEAVNYKSLDEVIAHYPCMNYTLARDLLRSCRHISGLGNGRLWKADFDVALAQWRASEIREVSAEREGFHRMDLQSGRRQEQAFSLAWRDWLAANKAKREGT